uniref:Uncharacterized protein n=1 Tax=Oryza brachyantha TaxID=4533 RepID=J3M4V6_ORYBR
METLMAADVPQQKAGGGLARRLSRLLRRKRSTAGSVAGGEYDESLDSSVNSLSKLKLSAATLDVLFRNAAVEKKGWLFRLHQLADNSKVRFQFYFFGASLHDGGKSAS